MNTALRFIFGIKLNDLEKFDRKEQLLKDLHEIKRQIDNAYSRFEFTNDDDLIESSIYEIESLKKRYQSLLKTAKEEKIECTNLTPLYEIRKRSF